MSEKYQIPEKFADHPIFKGLVCGSNFGFLSKRGYYLTDEAKKQPDLMKNIGINWTTLNINFCQEQIFSRKLFRDFEYTSGEYEIFETVKRLHDNGIGVILKPCLTCLDGGTMSQVFFPRAEHIRHIEGIAVDYWRDWFESYKKGIKYFADLAEISGCDSLMIGAEIICSENMDEYWYEVAKVARERFSGPITYEFTPNSRIQHKLDWLETLDYLSYSYYPAAAPANVEPLIAYSNEGAKDTPDYTVDDMVSYLSKCRDDVDSIIRKYKKPLLFTEIGVRSAHGCIMQPTNYQWDSPYDGQQQADYMEAVFRTFKELDGWMGLLWWKWDETQRRPQYHGDPMGDRGFTIQGKPAEEVMRRWFKKFGEKV